MRRRREEEHVNHERWAIPYGDLITLLLAFFVVMYAMSAVNEGKYRVMSQSILEAFNGSSRVIAPMPKSTQAPNTTAPAIHPSFDRGGSSLNPIPLPLSQPDAATRPKDSTPGAEQQNLNAIQRQVEHALQPLIDRKLVVLRRTPSWLEIEIRTDILFPSGVARLATPAEKVLDNLGQILAPFPNPLRVEGYTDDKPISTPQFPSNWELSAARAASVARLFAEHGVKPGRLGIMGWGQVRPVADNATAEGRNRNRRVLVVVLSDRDAPSRFTSDAEKLDKLADAAPSATPPAAVPPTQVGRSAVAPATGDNVSPTATAAVPTPAPAQAIAATPTDTTPADTAVDNATSNDASAGDSASASRRLSPLLPQDESR